MDKARRKKLSGVIEMIETVINNLEELHEQEQFSLDSVPENLSASDRFARMEDNVYYIDEAVENVKEARERLYNVG